MLIRLSILSALLAIATSMRDDILASSRLGSKILNKARMLDNAEEDNTWMVDYSLKFNKCYTIDSYGGEGADREEGGSPVSAQHIVHFWLCPSGSCKGGSSGCSGGAEYILEMREFIEAFNEAQEEQRDYNCENVRENCDCDNYYGDDEKCEANCYAQAGLDYCEEDDDGNNFDVDEYVECREAEFGNNNNNNNNYNNNAYYIGPYCAAHGNAVFLGVFTDATCETQASSNVFEKYNYGKELPYSNESFVHQRCQSCMAPKEDRDDDNDNQEEDQVTALCEELYEQSGKCEENLKSKNNYSRNINSCTYIHNVLPTLSKVHRTHGRVSLVANVFAWLFFLSTCALAGVVYYLHSKVERSSVNLADQDKTVDNDSGVLS